MFDLGGGDYSGDSGSLSSSDIFGALISAGTQIGTTEILANSNPTNAAILSGQSVKTPLLSTLAPQASSSMSLLLVVIVIIIGIFAFKKL